MKDTMKKYFPFLYCGLLVLLLTAVYAGVFRQRNAGTYQLTQLAGDAEYIEELDIRLLLGDDLHKQALVIAGNTLSHRYISTPAISPPFVAARIRNVGWAEHPDAEVEETITAEPQQGYNASGCFIAQRKVSAIRMMLEVYDAKPQTRLEALLYPRNQLQKYSIIETDVMVQNEQKPFTLQYMTTTANTNLVLQPGETFSFSELMVEGAAYTSVLGNGISPYVAEDSMGRAYIMPAFLPYFSGSAAIYRVDSWNNRAYYPLSTPFLSNGYNYYYPLQPRGQQTKLVNIPLDGQTRSMDFSIVQDTLCLLLLQEDTLYLRQYTLEGALLREIPLGAYAAPSETTTTLDVVRDNGETILCYSIAGTLDTGEQAPVLHVAVSLETAHCSRLETDASYSVLGKAFLGGRWVMLLQPTDTDSPASIGYQIHALGDPELHVYAEEGAMLYAGAINTDMREDYIQFALFGPFMHYGSQAYTYTGQRAFTLQSIQRRTPHAGS